MRTFAERLDLFKSSDIYPVVSSEFCNNRDVCDIVADIACAGAKIIQLREKNLSDCAMFELVKKCKLITDKYDMLLLVDDRVDIAISCGADGVHLGQDDFPLAEAKKLAPEDRSASGTSEPLVYAPERPGPIVDLRTVSLAPLQPERCKAPLVPLLAHASPITYKTSKTSCEKILQRPVRRAPLPQQRNL